MKATLILMALLVAGVRADEDGGYNSTLAKILRNAVKILDKADNK